MKAFKGLTHKQAIEKYCPTVKGWRSNALMYKIINEYYGVEVVKTVDWKELGRLNSLPSKRKLTGVIC